MTAVLAGRIAAAELAAGLQDRGLSTVLTSPEPPYDTELRSIAAQGPITGLIWAADPPAAEPTEIGDLPSGEWDRLGQQPLRAFFQWCQAVSALLGAGTQTGGQVVLLVPSVSLAGAPGLVPWTTSAEGQRSLAKALARKWGARGITVNTLAVPAAVLTGESGSGEAPMDRPGLQPLSLAALPSLRNEVAGVLASILTPAWSAVTGATVAVDGGQWMPS